MPTVLGLVAFLIFAGFAMQPSADAWVEVDAVYGDGRPVADTRSDANGHFVVCGLEAEPRHALVVAKPGYQLATVSLPTQGDGPLDVDLRVCTADRPRFPSGWCL